jgi:hypothetical protein
MQTIELFKRNCYLAGFMEAYLTIKNEGMILLENKYEEFYNEANQPTIDNLEKMIKEGQKYIESKFYINEGVK